MGSIRIRPNQTGLDAVNNTYVSQDYVYDMYIDNQDFDINEMQNGKSFDYSIRNISSVAQISNNNFIFTSGDEPIHEDILTLTLSSCYFDTDLGIVIYDIERDEEYSPGYIFKNVNGDWISFYEGTEDSTIVKLFDSSNEVKIAIDTTINNYVISSLDITTEYLETISANMNVGYNFELNMQGLVDVTDFENLFSGLNKIVISEETDTVKIYAQDSLTTPAKMENFLENLLDSSLAEVTSGVLYLDDFDEVPSGVVWDALVANGWSLYIVP